LYFVDSVVIGAGAVGLAIGAELAKKNGHMTVVVDAETSYGHGISSRNSEVIHAGIYYEQNSLKAQLCVRGNQLLYDFCKSYHVPFKQCGKLVVASTLDEIEKLQNIIHMAQQNEVHDLEFITQNKVRELEPQLNALEAVFSPSTGIIDSHQFMSRLVAQIESSEGIFAPRSKVIGIVFDGYKYTVTLDTNGEKYSIETNTVINSAGLNASSVADSIMGFPKDLIPKIHLCKGSYFKLSGKPPFRHLIYPIPPVSGEGLGIHATIDMQGSVRFGPDVEYIDTIDYEVNKTKRSDFYDSIRRYFPSVDSSKLIPDYCGIRPKLQGPRDSVKDFMIEEYSSYGYPSLIQLFGIESPGLTASLSIAEKVAKLVV
jgi:L-2-hydroxyglutarate oxidase LhgO